MQRRARRRKLRGPAMQAAVQTRRDLMKAGQDKPGDVNGDARGPQNRPSRSEHTRKVR